jgi:CDP-paratose 2-epimerase
MRKAAHSSTRSCSVVEGHNYRRRWFIGLNAAARALRRADEPVVLDNLSRPGATRNLEWLRSLGLKHFSATDLRDAEATREVFDLHRDASLVLHLAGQVAVTTSVANPGLDFEANALGL